MSGRAGPRYCKSAQGLGYPAVFAQDELDSNQIDFRPLDENLFLFDERGFLEDRLEFQEKAVARLNGAGIDNYDGVVIPDGSCSFRQVFAKERRSGARRRYQATPESRIEQKLQVAEMLGRKNCVSFGRV